MGMAVSETPRHKLKKYSAGTDPHPSRTVHNTEVDKLEQLPAVIQGSTGSRPLSGVGKVLYWDEAVKRFVYDDGTDWQDVAPIGGVTPTGLAISGNASEGTSHRAARGDHTHPLPLATPTEHGAMPSSDKTKLNASTGSSTPGTLVQRNSFGRSNFNQVIIEAATPADPSHGARMDYVDRQADPKTGVVRMAQSSFTMNVPGNNTIIIREIVFPTGIMRNGPHFTCHATGSSPNLPSIDIWWTRTEAGATVYIRSATAFPGVIFTWLAVDA